MPKTKLRANQTNEAELAGDEVEVKGRADQRNQGGMKREQGAFVQLPAGQRPFVPSTKATG